MNNQIKIFNYILELDAFECTKEYIDISETLGLAEWNYVVWIGRLFTMDDDYGEHWFDNWDERDNIRNKAEKLGYDSQFLYVINPKRFSDKQDGICHTDAERKIFWTDVLKSLTLSFNTLATFAINSNPPIKGLGEHIPNMKKKIAMLREKYVK
jgi:hypothetical protein